MTREEILEDIGSLLRQNRCKVSHVTLGTTIEQLEMDSIHTTALLLDMEDFFKVLMPDQEIESWKTIDQVVNYIEKYQSQAQRIIPVEHESGLKKKSERPGA